MGLFSKKACGICGREERMPTTFYNEDGGKTAICSECCKELQLDGIARYCRWDGRVPYYDTELVPFLKRREALLEGLDQVTAVDVGTVRIFERGLAFPGLEGVVVSLDEIYLITYFQVDVGMMSETLEVVFFTRNPHFPVLFEFISLKAHPLSFNKKAKEGRGLMESLYGDMLGDGLMDPMVEYGQLKKQMKADYKEGKSPELKALLSQLDEIRAGWGKYKLDKIAELMGMKTR